MKDGVSITRVVALSWRRSPIGSAKACLEVARLAFPGFVDLLSQAGGQSLVAVLAFQSVADLLFRAKIPRF
jgi:hypothetical protein